MILTTGPWRRALLATRRHPALLGITLFAGVIVGIVAASPTMFVDSAGSGAVQQQWARGCPTSNEAAVNWEPPSFDFRRFVEPTVASVGGFGDLDWTETTGRFNVVHDGKESALGLLARSGFRDHIDVIAEGDTGDLWLPDNVATKLAAQPGDTVTFGHSPRTDPAFVVRGIYRDLTAGPLGDYWCTAEKDLTASFVASEAFPPPRGLIEVDAVPRFADANAFIDHRLIVPFANAPKTLADARAAVARTDELERRLPADVVTAFEAEYGPEPTPRSDPPTVTSDIDRLEARATAVRAAVGKAVQPIALLAVASALAMASVLGLMWLRVKRNDAAAFATLGISPAAIGVKAGLETVLPLVAGTLLGAVVARLSLSIYAPASDLEPGTFQRAVAYTLIAALATTVLVSLTAGLASRKITRHTVAVRRAWWLVLPWEVAFLAATYIAWRGFRSSPLVAVVGTDVAGVSTRALTFPLLMFVTGALVTARVWMVVLSRRRRRRIGAVPVALAGRRLRFHARPGAVLVACGVIAIAISIYGAGLVTSLSRTAEAKVGVHLGSDVKFRVTGTLPEDTPDATQVSRRERITYGDEEVDLLVVDPATFARAAFWDTSFDDDSLAEILDQLSTPSGTAASALAIGDVAPAGTLTNTKGRPGHLDIEIVKALQFFPGADDNRPTIVIVTADAARSEFKLLSEVWAKGTYEQWHNFLTDNDVRPVFGVRASDAINSSTLLFASWSFEFVRALGAFVGLQVIIALLLQIASRQRKQALAFGFLRRMGLTTFANWRALAAEVCAYAAAMIVAGIALAIVAMRVVGVRLDPLPSAPPASILVLPWVALVLAVAIGLATAVAGTFAAQRVGARVNLSEALRDDQ